MIPYEIPTNKGISMGYQKRITKEISYGMKYFSFVLLGIVILGGVLFFTTEGEDREGRNTVTLNGYKLEVEVVRTPEEMAKGLSGRENLGENAGMLFIFPEPTTPSFWMKDMKFPIDIIWIAENKEIVGITENLAPETFPQVFYPRSPVQYALEVNAGWAQAHNVSIGEEVILNL